LKNEKGLGDTIK